MKPQLVYYTVYVNIKIFFHRWVNMGNPYVASKLSCLEKEEPQTNREGGVLGPELWASLGLIRDGEWLPKEAIKTSF